MIPVDKTFPTRVIRVPSCPLSVYKGDSRWPHNYRLPLAYMIEQA